MTPSGFILFIGCVSCAMMIEGISGQTISLYLRPEQDIALPCSCDYMHSSVEWFYQEDTFGLPEEIENGNVAPGSARASRLSVKRDCSLVIRNVSEEDAGLYTCVICPRWRPKCESSFSKTPDAVYLNILTVVPFVTESDRGEIITLECSLWRYVDGGPCPQNNLRWVDESGSVLTNENYKYKMLLQRNCMCILRVNSSQCNRKYTCQLVNENNDILISAEYTAVFTSEKQDNQTRNSTADCAVWTPLSSFMLALRILEVCMITVVTALLIRNTGRRIF